MPTYESIEKKQANLRRKALNGSMFVAPYAAPAVTTLTGVGGALAALPGTAPNTYVDAGLMADSGEVFARAIARSSSTSWGRTQPTREDITSDVTTIAVTLQETNKTAIGLYTGFDLSAVVPATSGEIKLDKPETVPDRYFRVLCLAVDKTAEGDFYIGRFFPRVKVTDYADQAFAKTDEGITWGVTITSYVDDVLGTSESWFFGGAGALARNAAMGFA